VVKPVLKNARGDFGGMPIPLSMTEILTHPPAIMSRPHGETLVSARPIVERVFGVADEVDEDLQVLWRSMESGGSEES